jgi:hypothetical protein
LVCHCGEPSEHGQVVLGRRAEFGREVEKITGCAVGLGAERLVERLGALLEAEVAEELSGLAGVAVEHHQAPQPGLLPGPVVAVEASQALLHAFSRRRPG